jgi:nucleotide-binding universal stress UspA family protein
MNTMFKTVLFPIDRSPDSQEAAETVASLAKYCQSRLIILSVEEVPEENAVPTDPALIDQLLAQAQASFTNLGISTETIHRQGKPAFTICDVADELEADLIIMGCRGIGLTQEGANESVSNRVINLAPCPVLIVP